MYKKQLSNERRLNKFIASVGICSRREADTLIQGGQITVNSQPITRLGYKVKPTDVVKYQNKILKAEQLVHILLNKPKDFITTTSDPQKRKTVMQLVKHACRERVYPVGRLDRNTTGLLLLTNDGDLAKKLSHPSNTIKKVYQVVLDKPMNAADFRKIQEGVTLEDGVAQVDELAMLSPGRKCIGLALHMGRNKIVRRIVEHLGYHVVKLDRVAYATLTKKGLPRGKWRFLTEKERLHLEYLSRS